MSRPVALGVLIILLALVGVMANIVQKPYHKDDARQQELTPAQAQAKMEAMKKQQEAQKKMMELEMKKMKPPKTALHPKPSSGGKPAGAMDLDTGWWERRAQGEAGIQQMKAKDEAEKREMERAAKMRSSGSPGAPPVGAVPQ